MTTAHLTLDPNGTLTLPDEFRRQLGLTPGEPLVMECNGDSLLVRRREPDESETAR